MIPDLGPRPKTILYAILNWGLGHATRSIPIIIELIRQGHNIILASDGDALKLLQREFPELDSVTLPSYNVTYKSDHLWHIVLSNSLSVYSAIQKEFRLAQKLISKHNADLVISDSRFGFRSGNNIESIIISHQLNLRSENPLLSFGLNRINQMYLNAFNACWIPDDKGHLLSGNLSLNPRINNQVFIGPISRLITASKQRKYDLAIILSGPEPARTKLEKSIVHRLRDSKLICLIRGTTAKSEFSFPTSWKVIDLATSDQINQILLESAQVFSRSGYTSIMDYYKLGKAAYLLPTPGQSEQEYLADHLDGKYGFRKVSSFEEWATSYLTC